MLEISVTKLHTKFTMEESQDSAISNIASQRGVAEWFTEIEDDVLATEILTRRTVLWDRLVPNKTNPERLEAWQAVADAVNSVGAKSRTAETIRKRYNYLKQKVKKKASNNHIERLKTGGGKAKNVELNEIELKILATIPKELIQGIDNGIDTCKCTVSLRVS